MDFKLLYKKIEKKFKKIPSVWNSKLAVLELSQECYPLWEQSEWLDFYFRYLCEKHLPRIVPMQEEVCGTTFFDGIQDFSPDLKSKKGAGEDAINKEDKKIKDYMKEFSLAYHNYQHWRQMEWVESYFNYLCKKQLSGLVRIPGPSYQTAIFPAFLEIPWLFKVYIENAGNKKIILADAELITQGLVEFEVIGIILASGIVDYNEEDISGNKDNTEINQNELIMQREMRQHSVFRLKHIYFIPLSSDLIQRCETFQPGGLRKKEHLRKKILLNVPEAKDRQQFSLDFSA